jgi:hypothetical protein
MVDLGQKGWKKFHLFYFNQVEGFLSIHIKKGDQILIAFFV